MKVLVIPEDPRLDQYMLKPLVEAALNYAGHSKAKVAVCQSGQLRGDTTIIGEEPLSQIIEDNQLYDAFFLCVDRDCREERINQLNAIQERIRHLFPNKTIVLVCGREELEVWALAGVINLPFEWKAVRQECHPKERYFEVYVKERRISDTPGRGREILGREAAQQYKNRVRQFCEEIRTLELPLRV